MSTSIRSSSHCQCLQFTINNTGQFHALQLLSVELVTLMLMMIAINQFGSLQQPLDSVSISSKHKMN